MDLGRHFVSAHYNWRQYKLPLEYEGLMKKKRIDFCSVDANYRKIDFSEYKYGAW